MRLPRFIFWIAGIYGLVVLAPLYFLEEQIGFDFPPPITHPEYFYGFVGVALSWQIAFLVIGQNPARYRPMIIPAILAKATFGIATILLFAQQRVSARLLAFGIVDLAWGVLFAVAFWRLFRGSKNWP